MNDAGTVSVDPTEVWPEDAMDVEEGVVSTWFVREGASVDAGTTLCEIQIEKVSVDVPSPIAGTLESILVPEHGEFERADALATLRPDG